MDKFSKLAVAIQESTDYGSTSLDDELDQLGLEDKSYIREMISSKEIVDQRLIKLYKLW